MAEEMKITYLLNSGFLLQVGDMVLVFDDYREPAGVVSKALRKAKQVYFFASHAHFDHFDAHILDYADKVTTYFFSDEIKELAGSISFPPERTVYLKKYDSYQTGTIKIHSFDSTDTGTSFLVEAAGWRIFHAGDFNWWHWKGDTEENQKLARNGFRKQMKKLDGLAIDLAFFPVDGRLEEYWAVGAREFCARTQTKALITMHNVGYPAWQPAADFFQPGHVLPYWSPQQSGESRKITIGGEFLL